MQPLPHVVRHLRRLKLLDNKRPDYFDAFLPRS
jgi:hypothetical protein